MKDIFKGIGILVLIGVLILAVSSAIWGWRAVTAPIRGWITAEEQIESAESRRYNYNWFYNKCAAIQSYEDQIENTKDALEQTNDDEQRRRYERNLLALKNQYNQAINDYNATSRKHYTAARFKDENLPERISKNGDTTCQ